MKPSVVLLGMPLSNPANLSFLFFFLLLSRLGLGLLLGPLLPNTAQSRVAPGLPQGSVGTTLDGGGKVALLDLGNAVGERGDG